MDVWQIALYGFAAFLALRLLVTLMERHRLLTLQKLAEEHQQKLAEERAAAKKAEDVAKKAA
jgi:hypothetical protein